MKIDGRMDITSALFMADRQTDIQTYTIFDDGTTIQNEQCAMTRQHPTPNFE